MTYKFCSICGKKLTLRKDGNLTCLACGFVNYRNPRPCATALVLFRGKLLLTKRLRAPFKGWWDLPGGFVDKGETPEKAARRELKEETGLALKDLKLFGIYPGTFPLQSDPFHVISIVYITKASKSPLKALDDVSESRWFAKKEMPKKIAFDSNQHIIKDFLKVWN